MKKILGLGALVLPQFLPSAYASVNVQTFSPALGTSYVYAEDALMQVAPGDSAWTGERMYFHLLYNYDHDPLVEYNSAHTARDSVLINSFNTFDLGVGILPLKNLMLAIDLPVNWVSYPSAGTQFGWGDMRLEAKYRVTEDNAPVAVALIPNLVVPTGDTTNFLSNNSVGVGFSVAVERDFGPFRASGNIGYRHFSDGIYQDIDYRNMIPMTLGAYIPIDQKWGINVEGSGALSMPVNHYNNPGEFYVGGHCQLSQDSSVLLGAAVGSVGGGGSGDYRVIAGVKFAPMDLLLKPRPIAKPALSPAPTPAPAPKMIPQAVMRPKKVVQPVPTRSLQPMKRQVKRPVKLPVKQKATKRKIIPTPTANPNDFTTTTTTTTTTVRTKVEHHLVKPGASPVPAVTVAPQP